MQKFRLTKKKIVLISPEPWGKNFLSKHHIANELARRGNKVFFIPPVGSIEKNYGDNFPKNVEVVSYRPIRGLNSFPKFFSRWLALIEINQIKKKTGFVDIVWSFDPHRLQFLKLFQAPTTIYHSVDNHQTSLEKRILEDADFFFSNAQFTLDKYDHLFKYKIGHGVASYFFSRHASAELPGDYTIKVGYVGNLANRLLDLDFFKQLAKDYPTIGFYLVGPRGRSNLHPAGSTDRDWGELDNLTNVYWLGEQPSHKLPSYLSGFDALLLLYRPDSSGFVVNAHKILEYLSSGKVIISYTQGDYILYTDLLVMGRTGLELKEIFGKVINNLHHYNSDQLMSERINLAKENTYDNQLDRIESILKTFAKSRVSWMGSGNP